MSINKTVVIAEIEGVVFYYGGWNENGWHTVFTEDENFHVGKDKGIMPTEAECTRIYKNYYL